LPKLTEPGVAEIAGEAKPMPESPTSNRLGKLGRGQGERARALAALAGAEHHADLALGLHGQCGPTGAACSGD
jgi:hypothetical protein